MKKKIFVAATTGYLPEMCRHTLPLIAQYARRIGAEFEVFCDRKYPNLPGSYEKLQIYEAGGDLDYAILLDADMVLGPDMPDLTELVPDHLVGCWMSYDASEFFPLDSYFYRDNRKLGVATNMLVVPFACWDALTPLEKPERYLKTLRREFLLDEFCVSRNVARFGLKVSGVAEFAGPHFRHLNVTTDSVQDVEKAFHQAYGELYG